MSWPFLSEHTEAEPRVTAQVVVPFSSTLQVMVVLSDWGPSTTAVAKAAETHKRLKGSATAIARDRVVGAPRKTRLQKGLVATGNTKRAPGQTLKDASK